MVSIITLFMAAAAQLTEPATPPVNQPPTEHHFVTEGNSLEKKFFALTEERNQKLLAICAEGGDSSVCKAIQDLNGASKLSEEEQAGLLFLEMLEAGKIAPANGSEEALVAISKEYTLKERAIDQSIVEKNLSLEEIQAKKRALYEEKWEKMGEVGGENLASAALKKWSQERTLFSQLHALEHNYVFPGNPTEERIQEVLIEYAIKRAILFS